MRLSSVTGVGVVLQGDHELRPLPQAFQEGHHQVTDVLRIVGGEGVLVSFDGCQSETLTLQLSSPESTTEHPDCQDDVTSCSEAAASSCQILKSVDAPLCYSVFIRSY